MGGDPPVIERGDGAYVEDEEGNRYLDLVGAYGPLILGHSHPDVLAATVAAAGRGGPYGHTTPDEVRLGRLIREAMPGVEKLRFTCSGTEAAMSALRVARAATSRDLILKFDGCYHGHSDGLLAKAGSGLATFSLPDSAGVPAAVAATSLIATFNDLESVERSFSAHPGAIAAVIVEPVAANMGVVPPATGFLQGLREICTAKGALLVFDEVITGFRVDPGGAQARYGVAPDLSVLGKIIGGGLPVGAYGGRAELLDLVAPVGPVYQAGTLAGHPQVMAAGIATLLNLTPELYRRLEALGARLEAGLRQVLPEARVERVASLLTPFLPSREAFAELHRRLRARGVLVPPSQFEAWFLNDAMTEADIDRVIEAA